jgi:hypothetical protein
MHHRSDPKTKILAIVQTGPEQEALSTSYLAELLQLSSDQPSFLYAYDLKKAEKNLLTCPLIAYAKLKRMPPETLYVDYMVRKPIALLADYENIGIDREGYLFPVIPFFSPKQLPELYLGLPPFGAEADAQGRVGGAWQTPLQNRYVKLAMEVLHLLSDASWREGVRIKRIDVSNAFAPSLGQREIVLFTEEELMKQEKVFLFPKILRLSPKSYFQQLNNFFSLRTKILEDYERQIADLPATHFAPRIIDLRIPKMAFVQNG